MSKFTKAEKVIIMNKIFNLVNNNYSAREISEYLNISMSTVYRCCNEMNIKIPNHHNILKFDNTVFDNIDTEEKAYWLGFLYADGNVGLKNNVITLTLAEKDREHIQKFNAFLKNGGKIYSKKCGKYKSCSLSVCNKYFRERLISLGCIPQKSLVLQFPNLSIFQDSNLVYDFIRGYVDGDGCLTFSRCGRLSINILGTKEFLNGILSIFPNLFTLHKLKRLKSNVWILRNCGKNADFVSTKLYKNANIYLERNYNRCVVLCRNV